MKFRVVPIKASKGIMADARKVSRAVENALNAAALGVKADFGVVTQTWKHKPTFRVERKTGERKVATTDEVFGYVDDGTKAHTIKPRKGPRLSFRANYRAKTRPRSIGSSTGGASGEWRFAKAVRHPGTAAREFSKTIAEKWDKQLPEIIQRAIDSEV